MTKEIEELRAKVAWLDHELIKTHGAMEWWMRYSARFSKAALRSRLTDHQWKEVNTLWLKIAAVCSSQRVAAFTLDCFMQAGEGPGILEKTIVAWQDWLENKKADLPQNEEFRHGLSVPAIPK